MVFMNVIAKNSMNTGLEPIPLHILQSSGIDTTPDISITTTNLERNPETNERIRNFHNNGYGGNDFKISVAFRENETVTNTLEEVTSGVNYSVISVLELLDLWITNMEILYVVTDAIGIENGEYIITGNSNRKQNYDGTVVWDLEFKEYNANNVQQYYFDINPTIAQALQVAEQKKKASKAKQQTKWQNKLKKCKNLKGFKLKESNDCNYYLNWLFMDKNYYNGTTKAKHFPNKTEQKIFKKATAKVIKKIQKKKMKMKKPNGKMDKKTWKYIVKKL